MQPPRPRIARARKLRREMSLPEVLLWQGLRGSRLNGWKFRRQHPAGPYVLDFYCAEASLAVEIDGYAHETEDRPERDRIRDLRLAERGVRTLRIAAFEVLASVDDVLATIQASIEDTSPSGPPGHLPLQGEGRERYAPPEGEAVGEAD